MKNTIIFLIFLLSILGLILGVYYTESADYDNSQDSAFEKVYEDDNGVITITLEKKEKNDLDKFFT